LNGLIKFYSALQVGRRKEETALILFRVRLSNKKVRQSAVLTVLSSFGRAIADLETKPALLYPIVQYAVSPILNKSGLKGAL
jgi:hypothetical protein